MSVHPGPRSGIVQHCMGNLMLTLPVQEVPATTNDAIKGTIARLVL